MGEYFRTTLRDLGVCCGANSMLIRISEIVSACKNTEIMEQSILGGMYVNIKHMTEYGK